MKCLIALTIILLLTVGNYQLQSEIKYGAFDPSHLNGIVMMNGTNAFAFRFIIKKDTDSADGPDTFYLVEKTGPLASDGSYAELNFNPALPFHDKEKTPIPPKNAAVTKLLRFRSTAFQSGMVGCIDIPEGISLDLLFYNPWETRVTYQESESHIIGQLESAQFRFIPVSGSFEKSVTQGQSIVSSIKPDVRKFYFYAGFERPEVTVETVENQLIIAPDAYFDKSPQLTGEYENIIAAFSSNTAWAKLFNPDKKHLYVSPGRESIFPRSDGTSDKWMVNAWNGFLNALLVAPEDRETAKQQIEAVLETQYTNGNIPGWRSSTNGTPDRSQPPLGAYIVLRTYLLTGDTTILSNSYDRLKTWHEYWLNPGAKGTPRRDGNFDGLLEWGCDSEKLPNPLPAQEKNYDDHKRAAAESGQENLPNFDNAAFDKDKGTLSLNCIDLSSLYALDTESMLEIATILNKKLDIDKFRKEYEALKKNINLQLWSEDFYYDRSWDGNFSTHKAASNFYPLLAGVPDKSQADKMIAHLQSPAEFWGDYVIPTISRDNPAFKDQQPWRGMVSPPVNYLVYQGLKRYGYDELASQLAVKNGQLFMKHWQNSGMTRDFYNAVSGEGAGNRFPGNGGLPGLMLMEEFIAITPYEGLRIGNLAASQSNQLVNISIDKNTYSIDASDQIVSLSRNNSKLFEFKGKAVLRNFESTDKLMSFDINVTSPSVDFTPFAFYGKPLLMTSEGQKVEMIGGYIRIPKGTAKIMIKLK